MGARLTEEDQRPGKSEPIAEPAMGVEASKAASAERPPVEPVDASPSGEVPKSPERQKRISGRR